MFAVAVLLSSSVLGVVPGQPPTETVDLVEINHCYNRDTGDRRFVQIIYWDRQNTACLHVRHWHMADKLQAIYPAGDGATRAYTVVRKIDGPQTIQFVRASRYRVTHTFEDPEEQDRKTFPLEARRPMVK
ncbi:MAG: hypothetical protein WD875_10930 [Pirellulales bacterium]